MSGMPPGFLATCQKTWPESSLNGEAVYVEGGRGWKIEQSKIDLRPQWLGERQTKDLDEGTRVLGGGEGWIAGQ
jgi:hypothetical protein